MFESWIIDLRYSARRLASRPTYALIAIFTLALGAGGTAAIFSIVASGSHSSSGTTAAGFPANDSFANAST